MNPNNHESQPNMNNNNNNPKKESNSNNNNNVNFNDEQDQKSIISYELSEKILGSGSNNVILCNIDGVEKTFQIERVFVNVFPPGYHFIPTDEELIIHYLKKRVMNEPIPYSNIKEINLYKYNPQELTEKFPHYGENEWLFFTPRDRKYRNGTRPNRAAGTGYWKATGADKEVHYMNTVVGTKKSLVFYKGKPPKGDKTNWIMHEYRVDGTNHIRKNTNDMRLDDWVLCRIHKKVDRPARNQQETENNPDLVETSPEVTGPIADDMNDLADMGLDDIAAMEQSNWKMNEIEGGHFQQAVFSNVHCENPHMVDPSFENFRFINNFLLQSSSHIVVPNPIRQQPIYHTAGGFKQESSHNVGQNPVSQPMYPMENTSGYKLKSPHNVGQSSIRPCGLKQESPHNVGQSSAIYPVENECEYKQEGLEIGGDVWDMVNSEELDLDSILNDYVPINPEDEQSDIPSEDTS